jgi:hypothetical protein
MIIIYNLHVLIYVKVGRQITGAAVNDACHSFVRPDLDPKTLWQRESPTLPGIEPRFYSS